MGAMHSIMGILWRDFCTLPMMNLRLCCRLAISKIFLACCAADELEREDAAESNIFTVGIWGKKHRQWSHSGWRYKGKFVQYSKYKCCSQFKLCFNFSNTCFYLKFFFSILVWFVVYWFVCLFVSVPERHTHW